MYVSNQHPWRRRLHRAAWQRGPRRPGRWRRGPRPWARAAPRQAGRPCIGTKERSGASGVEEANVDAGGEAGLRETRSCPCADMPGTDAAVARPCQRRGRGPRRACSEAGRRASRGLLLRNLRRRRCYTPSPKPSPLLLRRGRLLGFIAPVAVALCFFSEKLRPRKQGAWDLIPARVPAEGMRGRWACGG